MRVAVDGRYLKTTDNEVTPKGGIGRYTYNLLKHMVRIEPNLELRLIVPRSNGRPVFRNPPCHVEEVRFGNEPNTLKTRLLLSSGIDLANRQVFHSPFNMVPSGLPCPAVVTIHDLMWLTHPRLCSKMIYERLTIGAFYRSNLAHALGRADQVITVSEASRREIEAFRPGLAGRVTVAHHGVGTFFWRGEVDEETVRREVNELIGHEGPFVLCVGQGSPYKNHPMAIRAFLEAFRYRPEYKLVLVRRFSRLDADLLGLVARPWVRRRLILLPSIGEEQLRVLYSRAHVFLFPSLMEGFGIPLLEAMASGTPVLSSEVSSMPEVCGDAALLVDPTNVDAVAAGLRRLDSDKALRAELIERGRERAATFRWEHCARKTLDVYRRVIHGRDAAEFPHER